MHDTAQPAHAADRFAGEILAILERDSTRSRRLMRHSFGRTNNRSRLPVLGIALSRFLADNFSITIDASAFHYAVVVGSRIIVITPTLLAALRSHFPDRELVLGTPPDPIIRIPAQHPAVGNISVWDDGEEVTLEIGDIAHGHFAVYDSPSVEEFAQAVTDQVIAFLEALFADRVLLWKIHSGGAGGFYVLEAGRPFTYRLPTAAQCFVWSGPKALEEIVATIPTTEPN